LLPAPKNPIVCYVTARSAFGVAQTAAATELIARVRTAVAAGVDWIQVREKDLPSRALVALVRDVIGAAESGTEPAGKVIVNDRLDVALTAGADGVHLGRESVPVAEVVRWCCSGNAPKEFLIGVSCHTVSEALEAQTAGASYLFFGPVFDTPSKRAFGPPQGAAKLAEICLGVRLPVLAIGGVSAENSMECLRAGAAGVAAIREFQQDADGAQMQEFVEQVHSFKK
jgi:thiamine-phosphate pyrophosphorylase